MGVEGCRGILPGNILCENCPHGVQIYDGLSILNRTANVSLVFRPTLTKWVLGFFVCFDWVGGEGGMGRMMMDVMIIKIVQTSQSIQFGAVQYFLRITNYA